MSSKWLVTISEDNFQIALNKELIGVSHRWHKPLEEMKEGDNITFYISKKKVGRGGPHSSVSAFAGLAEVDGPVFVSEEHFWHSKGAKAFPYRRKIKFLPTVARIKALEICHSLEFIKNPDYWMLYFLTAIRKLSDADYETIKSALV